MIGTSVGLDRIRLRLCGVLDDAVRLGWCDLDVQSEAIGRLDTHGERVLRQAVTAMIAVLVADEMETAQ